MTEKKSKNQKRATMLEETIRAERTKISMGDLMPQIVDVPGRTEKSNARRRPRDIAGNWRYSNQIAASQVRLPVNDCGYFDKEKR